MVRIFGIASLALAAVSAVSAGHIARKMNHGPRRCLESSCPSLTSTPTSTNVPSPSFLPAIFDAWHYNSTISSYSPGSGVDACGQIKNDFDKVAAMNLTLYGKSVCGRNVEIKTMLNGKLKRGFAAIYDDCPDCDATSLRISKAVVNKIGDLNHDVPLTVDWRFK